MADAKKDQVEDQVEEGRVAVVPVHVHTDAGTVVYNPGDTVPAEHVELITNPAVWGSESDSD